MGSTIALTWSSEARSVATFEPFPVSEMVFDSRPFTLEPAIVIEVLKVARLGGRNVTMILHVEPPVRVAPQVPPRPGKEPPRNENPVDDPAQPAKEYVLSEAVLHAGARVNRWEEKAGFSFLFDSSRWCQSVSWPRLSALLQQLAAA